MKKKPPVKPITWPKGSDGDILASAAGRRAGEFSAEQLHVMIAHGDRLDEAIASALDMLESEPFIEAGNYPGDLLAMVLLAQPGFWKDNAALYQRCAGLIENLRRGMGRIEEAAKSFESPASSPWHP